MCFFFSPFVLFFFSIPLPHLQWLCYQGSQAKGWSNHNFSAGLGRNNEVTKLQLPWQRHIQEHRMPLLKKKKNRRNRAQDFSSLALSLCLSFSYPSLSIFLPLSLPSSPSPRLSFFLFFFFKAARSAGEQFTFTPSVFQSLLFLNIFRIINSLLSTFPSFWYSYLVGGLFPLILTWLYLLYKAH